MEWQAVLRHFDVPRTLRTRTRRAEFEVSRDGQALLITPGSGKRRRLNQNQFERVTALLSGAVTASDLLHVTFNGSYLLAIFDELRDGR